MSDYHALKREGNRKTEIDFPTIHFTNSVKEVIHTMTGMEVIETNLENTNGGEFLTQISGVILLTGQRNMMVSLGMSMSMAATMVSFMTGIQPVELQEEDICDGIEEIIHMIAGTAKARLKSWKYDLISLLPFAVLGDGHRIIHKNNVIYLVKRYKVAENDIILKVHFI